MVQAGGAGTMEGAASTGGAVTMPTMVATDDMHARVVQIPRPSGDDHNSGVC